MRKFKPFSIHSFYRIMVFLLCSCCFESTFAVAEDEPQVKYLVVWERQGGVAAFPLSTKPCLTFDVAQDKVNVTNTEKEVSFSLQKIHKYTLEATADAVLGLEKLTTQQGDFVMDAHTLIFQNYPSLTKVSVYTLDGKLLESQQMDPNGQLQLSIQQWRAGVYFVKVGGTTYKIIKK